MPNNNFTPFPILKTQRLTLRQLLNTDTNEIFNLRSNHLVNKYLERSPCKSIEDANVFINTVNKNIQENKSLYWAITLIGNPNLIGTICLFDFSEDNTKAEIGYELLPDFQGNGLMHEALAKIIDYGFKNLGLHLIEAYSHFENSRSTKLLENFKFKKQEAVSGDLIKLELTAITFNSNV